MFTILPWTARRCGSASRATRNGPRALVSKTASHCSRVSESSGADSKDGGIVDHQIEPPEAAHGGGDSGAHRGLGAHIALDSQSAAAKTFNLAGSLGGFSAGGAVGDGHVRAGLRQGQRNAPANAPRAAGDQCRFAAEWLGWHHRFNDSLPGAWLVVIQGVVVCGAMRLYRWERLSARAAP